MKQKILLIVALAFLSAALLSCKQSGLDNTETGRIDTTTDGAAPEAGTSYNAPYLPDADYGGYEFRVATIRDDRFPMRTEFDVGSEDTAEVFNDAIYRRNRLIEEKYNVVFKEIISPGDVFGASPHFRKIVKAGSDDFDMHMLICREAFSIALEGMIAPVSSLPYVDVAQPWYAQQINRDISIGGKLFFAYSDECINMFEFAFITIFNKNLISDLGMENVYALVDGGKWTIDKFFEMAKAASHDTDGRGYNENGRYGIVGAGDWFYSNFWIGADINTVMKDSDGLPYFDGYNNEKLDTVLNKVYDYVYGGDKIFLDTLAANPFPENSTYISARKIFSDGNALFWAASVGDIQFLRAMDYNFGIAPIPKYDEAQETYRTRTADGWINVVPSNAPDFERTSVIMEAIAVESKNHTLPAYYDIALKSKHLRDEDSERMLDLIYDTRTIDPGDAIWMSLVRDTYLYLYIDGKNSFTSAIEKKLPQIEKAINAAIEAFGKLE